MLSTKEQERMMSSIKSYRHSMSIVFQEGYLVFLVNDIRFGSCWESTAKSNIHKRSFIRLVNDIFNEYLSNLECEVSYEA